MNYFWLRLAFCVCSLIIAVSGALLAAPVIPCSDNKGCPDTVVEPGVMAYRLVLDERIIYPDECKAQEGEGQPGERRLLRFNFYSLNLGPGDLIVGGPSQHPEWFTYAPCHGHFHFNDYADYRLWTPGGYEQYLSLRAANPEILSRDLLEQNPSLAAQMIGGHKQGFCVEDSLPCDFFDGLLEIPIAICPRPRNNPRYTDCAGDQGITVGWGDLYGIDTDGQWVSAPNAGGVYVLEAEINAGHFYEEANYANNSTAICVNIPPKNSGETFMPDPNCFTPTILIQPTDCDLCLFNCSGLSGCTSDPGGFCESDCSEQQNG